MQKRRESVPRGPQFTAEGRQRQEEFWRRLVRAQHDRVSTHPAAGIRELTPRGWKESLERQTAAAVMTAG